METHDTLAAEVKFERERLGLTQEDLAHEVGVTLRTISRIELGKSRGSRLFRLAWQHFVKRSAAK